MQLAKRMGLALLFETLENVPLFLGGALAVWWSEQGQVGYAIGVGMLGSGLGALAIHYSESYQSPGFESTWRKTFFNFSAFVVCTVAAGVYFQLVRQGGWWDVVIGLGLGLMLSVLEAPSFSTWSSWGRHAGSMMIATGIGLVVMRGLASQPTVSEVITATLLLTVMLSVIITALEYWPQWLRQTPSKRNVA